MEILMLLREIKMRKIRELLAKSLFRLASTDYQIHYIDNSTIYEYVAPEDLIEEVANFCREAQLDCFKNNFSERELEFANILRNKILNLPNGDIYGTNIWAGLKIDAEKFLNILGYQIKDFDYSTIDNIDRNELGK